MNENVDYDKMWKEIIEIGTAGTRLLPGEKTLKMFMEETGMTDDVARRFIKKMIEENKLCVRRVHIGKSQLNVYSPILHNDQ